MRREEGAAAAEVDANDDELQSSNSKRKINTRTRNISVFSYLTVLKLNCLKLRLDSDDEF